VFFLKRSCSRLVTKKSSLLFTGSHLFSALETQWVFGSVVVVAFQIAFRAEIHANDIFSFFKNHF
jgi:hypothetical protein